MKRIIIALLMLMSFGMSLLGSEKNAPDFRLKDQNGKNVKLYEILEKGPVLLDFWATWCTGCKEEMPMFDKLNKRFRKQGLQMYMVSIDKGSGVAKAKSYVKAQGYTFDVLFDKGNKVFRKYSQGNKSVPLTILINKDRKITYNVRGKGTQEMFEKEILKVLKK